MKEQEALKQQEEEERKQQEWKEKNLFDSNWHADINILMH